LKIVLVGTANPYRSGGISSFNERLALELKRMGHEIIIYNFTLQYPDFLFPGTSQFADTPRKDEVPTLRKVNSINPFNWIKIGLELYKMRPDLLLFRFWTPFMGPCFGTIAHIAKKNGHTKVHALVDNAIPHEAKITDKIFSKYFYAAADKFVAISQKVQSQLQAQTAKPVAYSPHPIYDIYGEKVAKKDARAYFQLHLEQKVVLFFGFIREYKGLDLLIESMKSNPDVKLIVAGEFYIDSKPYFELAEKLGVAKQILWRYQFIADEEIKYYFSAADAVILPYKNATQSGITQIAYHFNTPMIATNVGGLEDFVKDGEVGFLVNPDMESIAKGIRRFYDEDKEIEFSENVKIAKKAFDWNVLASNTVY
jgi:glycosyltransferase involved in cell wall biosynthesis